MKLKLAVLAVLLTFFAEIRSDTPVFSIIGLKAIRQGQNYVFTASSNALSNALNVNFVLSGRSDNGDSVSLNLRNQQIGPKSIQTFTFNTRSLKPGSYSLSFVANDPRRRVSYKDSYALSFTSKRSSAFIYTDKALYRSGDLVSFSVFAVDSETRPFNSIGSTITITDPNSIKIQVFSNNTFVSGKFEGSLQLSSSPTLGQWSITLETLDGQTYYKDFEVANYVLPTFSVNLNVPNQVYIVDSSFPVQVSAQYTFGKPVKGQAVITFFRTSFGPFSKEGDIAIKRPIWPPFQETRDEIFSKTVDITSPSLTFDVNIAKDLKITNDDFLNVDVVFTESLTKKQSTAASTISFVKFNHEIVFSGPNTFAPNQTYNYTLSLRTLTGKPAPAGTIITVLYSFPSVCFYDYDAFFWNCTSKTLNQSYKIDSLGSVNAAFNPGNEDYVSIQASSAVSQNAYSYIYREQTNLPASQNVLDSVLITEKPTVGSRVCVKVTTSLSKLKNCFFNIVSKGILISSGVLTFKNKEATLIFLARLNHAPQTNIIFYVYNSDGSISSSTTYIPFGNNLTNFVNLKLSSNIVEPGANVSLSVSSYLNSVVSLFAIDSASLLAKSGNDFSVGDVFNDLSIYNNIVYDNNWWLISDDLYMFRYSNLFVLRTYINGEPDITTTSTPGPIEQPTSTVKPELLPSVVDAGNRAPKSEQQPRVRKNFAETIKISDVKTSQKASSGDKGFGTAKFTAPDSITTYIVKGVSMNDNYGLGLTQDPASLTVFLPFFIQVTLPYQIKRGEILSQDILVFSFLNEEQTVTLSITYDVNQFEVLKPEVNGWKGRNGVLVRDFKISPNDTQLFKVDIRPKVIGFIDLAIKAVGPLAGDSVLQPLKVIPEGVPQSITQSLLILKNDSTTQISSILKCELPPTAVTDTTSAYASVIGDLIGDALNNLDSLIQLPGGCGEQTMLSFVPNIVILIYLEATGQDTEALRSKIISYTLSGYQNELTYRRTDGSFSAFGNSDPIGSTWLTCYVVKSFLWAVPYITIDQNVITSGFDFIISKQNPDGSFREDGNVIHKDMQGGAGNGIAMTSYIVITLLKNLQDYPQYTANVVSALNYIKLNLNSNNVYDLTISTYALYLGFEDGFIDFSIYENFYNQLLSLAIETPDQLYWESPNPNNQNQWWWSSQPQSNYIEVNAYALRLIMNFDLTKAVKIAKYVLSKKNAFGGYGSSQDTVVGLTALARLAALIRSSTGALNINLQPNIGSSLTAQVTAANSLTIQTFDLDPHARELTVSTGSGSVGTAIVSLTCNFYEIKGDASSFDITHRFISACTGLLLSEICVSFTPTGNETQSNMAIVTVTLLSGYTYDNSLEQPTYVKRIESSNGRTSVDVYFDFLTEKPTCFNIQSIQENVVSNLKPATIKAIDYYDTFKRGQTLYSIPDDLSACENQDENLSENPSKNPSESSSKNLK